MSVFCGIAKKEIFELGFVGSSQNITRTAFI